MDIRKLQRAIVDGLEDVKAQDIKVYDTSHLTELFDRVVIASGTSNRQTKALAASVRDTVKEAGGHIVAVEGLETGEWVLVDCGDAVVHILQPQLRLYYNLEEIWGDKPVRMKLAAGVRSLAKASEPMDEDEDEVPAARGTRRASSLRPALARLPEGMKEPSPPMGHEDTDPDAIATVRKPARKTAAKTGTKTAATKTAGTRAAAPRKTAAGTTARKTAPRTATKTATKTAGKTAGKTATKTAAAKPAARKRTTRPA
ncbi:ribosome silencing factor [Cupriavidus oxalaticus]|uniref:Ribosomal silencing factor RsfS n=1 Tax=Cupriavidus oxalaticus TaxID=96344 RepID=A0A976BER3_9BURK|nr:ribosome silencing factor [Cupriavidus oxalaticus]QRQ86647.1 ribosome silencing factor [Cupriavidus oxalaticus]QRQ95025.1 ribosome silencing factor [Cupriavidus oxalaticus]WQD83679.1 ribosome silencing factor [Cupriavidus oxalaticus]SPC16947.1 Ribosomal silencing factor RsfS [Cupriavidus oxalaticus]